MEYTVSNVHECFENCVIMFQQQAESKNQTISLTEQIMYPYVYMDEPHLSEVCLNIISNAIKYTNTGGWISCNVVQKSCEKEDWCKMESVIKSHLSEVAFCVSEIISKPRQLL